jgi:tetratricopeptide (TPR) repeat protein
MQFIKKHWLAKSIGLLIVVIIVIACFWYYAKINKPIFPINANDTITSWSFKGAYAGNDALIAQAHADITKLSGLVGKGQYPDYEIFVGIAQDYDFLGDGKDEFNYLEKAIKAGPTGGTAWNNMGVLMEKLGALNTARAAYAEAVTVEPSIGVYQEAQARFLVAHFSQDTGAIETAFQTGIAKSADPNLLPIEADWLSSIGSTTAAIAAWKEFSTYVASPSQLASINIKIAQLKAKQ